MLATGTDAIAERQDWNKIRYADDTLMLCVQGATHWDALGHIFYEDKAYNGYDAKLIDAKGLNVLGIEHSKNKMVGRGVLLDIARLSSRFDLDNRPSSAWFRLAIWRPLLVGTQYSIMDATRGLGASILRAAYPTLRETAS
jgi:hypothetical protein